ncbi:MAG TPA: hypothetical protein VGH13_22350 [Xanthobacteraceae bacterium]
MSDTDPNKVFADSRASLKDTAKWIVTIIGATVVLVIGGGLVAKIADLDWTQRLFAAGSLLVLTMACLVPLGKAIDIVAAKLVSFDEIATSKLYKPTRKTVNGWMANYISPVVGTVEALHREYLKQSHILNNPNSRDDEKSLASTRLAALQPRVKQIIELSNTEFLRGKFDALIICTKRVLVLILGSLFAFLIAIHRDDQTERQLADPILLQVPWNASVEAAMKKAGMDEKCFAQTRPQLLQLSEKSGLRAGVLAIPRDLGAGCPAVRVIVTKTDEVYADSGRSKD